LVFDSEWDCVHVQKAENKMMNIIVNLGADAPEDEVFSEDEAEKQLRRRGF